ncbi:hypothetical protein AV530_019550 [Patagioenas fasciata monilis]|uniref:Uncharacterized protein n=1 Tax=Patagioenas fasciata monilis TaxID=372326 RepID=A0A1V4JE72_PATFA|nr:hypothetical protein AV530_019550 [Patagioenas fasciata monilis]
MVWDQWEKRRDAVTDPDTLCSDELQPVDASSHRLSKLESEEDVDNIPYMENSESYHGICIEGSFCGSKRRNYSRYQLFSIKRREEEDKTTLVWKSSAEWPSQGVLLLQPVSH